MRSASGSARWISASAALGSLRASAGGPAVRGDGGSRVGQALLVPLPGLGAIAGVAIRVAQSTVDRHHHAHLLVGDGWLVAQQVEGLLRRRDGLLELVEANRHERRAG